MQFGRCKFDGGSQQCAVVRTATQAAGKTDNRIDTRPAGRSRWSGRSRVLLDTHVGRSVRPSATALTTSALRPLTSNQRRWGRSIRYVTTIEAAQMKRMVDAIT